MNVSWCVVLLKEAIMRLVCVVNFNKRLVYINNLNLKYN